MDGAGSGGSTKLANASMAGRRRGMTLYNGVNGFDAIPEFKPNVSGVASEATKDGEATEPEDSYSRRDWIDMVKDRQRSGRTRSRLSSSRQKLTQHKVFANVLVRHTFPSFQQDLITPKCCEIVSFGAKPASWTCTRCGCSAEQHDGGMCPTSCLRAHRAVEAARRSVRTAGLARPYHGGSTNEEAEVVDWLMDTGCNQTATRLAGLIGNRRATRIRLQGISKDPETIRFVGDVVGSAVDENGQSCDVLIEEVGHLASTPLNLLAVSPLVRNGAIIHLEKGNCYLLTKEKRKIPIEERDGLYVLRLEHYASSAKIRAAFGATAAAGVDMSQGSTLSTDPNRRFCGMAADLELWHRRLGHASPKVIKVTYDKALAEGFKIQGGSFRHGAKCNCDACRIARAHRASQPKARRFDVTPKAWRTVQTDLQGPVPKSFDGNKFSIKFICEHSRESYVYFMENKEPASVVSKFREFLKDLRNAGHDLPVTMKTDSGSEFYNTQAQTQVGRRVPLSMFSKVCAKHRIRHVVTPAHNSTLNGLVERQHRSLHESANAYLYDARLGVQFWEYAVKYANWVKNRIYHSALTKTPYEMAHGLRPRLDRARVWGCDMFEFQEGAKIPGAPKARRLIFVGIPENAPNGFLGFDPETRTVRLAYDVTFDEDLTRRQGNLRVFDHKRHVQEEHLPMHDMPLASQSDRLDSDAVRTLYTPEQVEMATTGSEEHGNDKSGDYESGDENVEPQTQSLVSDQVGERFAPDSSDAEDVQASSDIDDGGAEDTHTDEGGAAQPISVQFRPPERDGGASEEDSAIERSDLYKGQTVGATDDGRQSASKPGSQDTDSLATTQQSTRVQAPSTSKLPKSAIRRPQWKRDGQGRSQVLQVRRSKATSTAPQRARPKRSPSSLQGGDSLASCLHGRAVTKSSLSTLGHRGVFGARGGALAVSPSLPQKTRIHKYTRILGKYAKQATPRGSVGRHLRAEAPPRALTMAKASKARAVCRAAPVKFRHPRESSDCVVLRMPHSQARPVRVKVARPVAISPGRWHFRPEARLADIGARTSRRISAPGIDLSKAPSSKPKRSVIPTRAPPPRSSMSWDSEHLSEALESFKRKAALHGPMAPKSVVEYHRQKLLESTSLIRPHRFERIGQVKTIDKEDRQFLREAMARDLPIQFVMDTPKTRPSMSRDRYSKYRFATTLSEMVTLSVGHRVGRMARQQARALALKDIDNDYARGYILFPKHESVLPGHFVDAIAMAKDNEVECMAEKLRQMHKDKDFVGSDEVDIIHKAFGMAATTMTSSLQSKLESINYEALKYLENPDQLSAFMAHHLAARQFLDPETGTWHTEPKNDKDVERGPDTQRWGAAKQEEMNALEELGTYDLVTDCPVANPMGCRFVYKLKTDDGGVNIKRWKARCVVRGFMSRPGIDHDEEELYAPVLAYDSFRTLLAISAGKGWGARQIDISNAYLQGRLVGKDGKQQYIYVQDPLSRKCPKTGKPYFLRLKKPLYGLKQAGRRWQEELHQHLRAHGFERLPSDKCLFKVHKLRRDLDKDYDGDEVETLVIGTYVDDILMAGSSDRIMDWFDSVLKKRFKINRSEAGQVNHMLGARIRQDLKAGTLTMDQTAAIEALAKKFKLDSTNASPRTSTPMTQQKLHRQEHITDDTGFPYLSAVGSLLHIAGLTRPDIAYSVGVVARYSNAYGAEHVKAVKRIIAYLYHSRHRGIMYFHESKRESEVKMFESGRPPITDEAFAATVQDPLRLFADADFAGDDTKRSTSGNIVFLYGGPIMWSSRLQKLYALSTAESEIYSATEALKDASFLQLHLSSLGIRSNKTPIPVHEDNAACRMMAENDLKIFNKARHYLVRLGFLQDKVTDGTAKFVQTDTSEMIADALTKPLVYDIFKKFRDIMVKDVRHQGL